MTSDYDFSQALERIEYCIDTVGDGVKEEIVDDGQKLGFVSERWGARYFAVGLPDVRYFEISYPYSLVGTLEDILDESNANDLLDGVDTTGLDGSNERQAAEHLMNSMAEATREKLRFHLREKLSTPDTNCNIHTSNSGGILRFEVRDRIYPLEDDFSLNEFESSVQSVMNVGTDAAKFLSYAFNIEEYVDSQTSSEMIQPRYIR